MRDWGHTIRRTVLVAEALGALAFASAVIRLFRFRRVATLASRGVPGTRPLPDALARDIGWAVAGWARRVPWRAVCFQQGLAAQSMLRRRGHAATLYYGARRDAGGRLVAHVWVRSGDTDIIGCDEIDSYGLLAAFPPSC